MLQAKTKEREEWDAWVETLPEVEYPPEVVARWRREREIDRAQIASGELKPQTAAELAAEFGIELDYLRRPIFGRLDFIFSKEEGGLGRGDERSDSKESY